MARWVTKGAIAARSGKYSSADDAWHSIKGKPPMNTKPKGWRGDAMLSGKYVTAQQEFLRGYHTAKSSNPKHRRRNGRSYVRKGVSIGVPRYSFDPKKGDQFYISGKLVTIKRVDGDGMLWFNREVDGTVAMSAGNLYQAAYVPENSRFAPYDVRLRSNPGRLMDAIVRKGKRTFKAKAKYDGKLGRVRVFVNPSDAKKINPKKVRTVVFYDVVDGSGYALSRSHYHKSEAQKALKRIKEEDARPPYTRVRKLKIVKRVEEFPPGWEKQAPSGKTKWGSW